MEVHDAGGDVLRRGRRSIWGCAAIAAGILIILALVLPTAFWWFMIAVGLIAAGLWYLRCC